MSIFRKILRILIELNTFIIEPLHPDHIIWMYRQEGLVFTIFGIIIILVVEVGLVLTELFIIYGFFYGLYKFIRMISVMFRTKETYRYNVQGTIYNKKYNYYYITNYMLYGKVPFYYHDKHEEYNVFIKYKNVTKKYNNKSLFEQYDEGDKISLILVQKLDKNNNIINEYLELPD